MVTAGGVERAWLDASNGWHVSHDGSTNKLQLFSACF